MMRQMLVVCMAAMSFVGFAEPVRVIYDTDMLMDCGDAGGLACLHTLEDRGRCKILATVCSTTGTASVAVCEVINGWRGRPDIPVGCVREGARPLKFPEHLKERDAHGKFRTVAAKYSHLVRHADSAQALDATRVCREALAGQPDGSVVICCVGPLTNMRNLLRADRELVARKVRRLVVMGGRFPDGGQEFNLAFDPDATRTVLADWPTEIVFCGSEVGRAVYSGRQLVDCPTAKGPVKDLYALSFSERLACDTPAGHPSWDPLTALVAVGACEGLIQLEHHVVLRDSADVLGKMVDALLVGDNVRPGI